MGDLEPLGVNFGPIYAQNLSLKKITVIQKMHPKALLKPRQGSQTNFKGKLGHLQP